MKSLPVKVMAACLVLAATAAYADQEQREMKIVVARTAGDEATTIHWVGNDDPGFDMHAMQVGESQSIVDESGRAILITREQDGFRFEVDGETVTLPAIGEHGESLTVVEGSDVTADFDVEIISDGPPAAMHAGNTVMIFSDEPLDASIQESIRAVLQSAGRDDTVTFVDRSTAAGGKQVKVIRKRVEIQQ